MRVVAIQNYGPSGSMLLHSLFDGHPEILTLPGLYPLGIYTQWRMLLGGPRRRPARRDVVESLMTWMQPLYDQARLEVSWGLTELGDGRDEHCCVDEATLRCQLIAALDEGGFADRRNAITSMFLAYGRCLGRDVGRATTIVYPAHSSEIQDLRELSEDFPDIRFLHTIRDPVDGLFSTAMHGRRWQERFGGSADPFRCAIIQITADRTPLVERKEPFYSLRPFDTALASRSRAIKLEDLHARPEAVMRAVAEWAGVTWDATLLESTFAGKRWWNRPGLRRLSGFSEAMSSTPGVAPVDRARIAAVTAPLRREYGYDRSGWRGRLRDAAAMLALPLPFAPERASFSVRRYIANRMALLRGARVLRAQRDRVPLLPLPPSG